MEFHDRPARPFQFGAVFGGLILVTVGAGLLFERSGLVRMDHLVAPIVLIGLGALMTFEHSLRERPRASGGLWLIGIGVWLLVSQNHLWGFTFETSWPLFIVLTGVMMVVRAWR